MAWQKVAWMFPTGTRSLTYPVYLHHLQNQSSMCSLGIISLQGKPNQLRSMLIRCQKNKQWEYGCDQRTFPMGFASASKRNSRTMTDDPITSPTPSFTAVSRLGGKGGSKDDQQSRPLHFNIISPSETSFSTAFKSSHSVGSKAHINLKDDTLLHKGAFSSGVELKLGQPSQQGCGSGTTAISAMRLGIRDFQTIPLQQQLTQNLENSKVFEHGDQRLHCHSGSVSSRTKEQFLLDFQKNAPSTANDAFCVGRLKDGLSKSSLVSVISPPNNKAAPVSMHHKENSDMINNHGHYIPWTLPFQPHGDKSALVDIPYNRADGSIKPSGINKSASGMNKTSTSNTKRADNCCNIGSESSFRFYVKQMENCGFFIRDGKTFATVPGEKYNSLQMAGMLPEISYASSSVGKVCSLKSDRDPDHSNSSLGFGRSPTLHGSSSGCSPLTGVMGSGHDSASLNNYVDDVHPHDFDESLRVVTLRNVEKSFKEKPTDACLGVNERPRSYSGQRQKRENCGAFNFNLQGSFLNPGPPTGSDKNPFIAAHSYSPTFMHDTGCKKAGNIRERTNAEGTNNMTAFGAFTRGIPFNSEMTGKCNRGTCVLQPKEQLSLRVETKVSGCNMLQRCCEDSSAYISGRNNSMVQTIHSNRELHSRGENTIRGLKKQVRVGVVEDTQLNGSRFVCDSSPTEKTILSECNQKVKKQLHGQLDFQESQWRDVPSKLDPISMLKCPVAPHKFLDKSGGAESHLKELSAKDISTSDQAAILKDRELSNISSGCSAPAITQASITDAGDTGCVNDQIADQGSAIDRSWSSFDATDSVKSSQQACCGKGRSTEEESLEVSPNVECQEFIDEFKQQQSKSKKSKKLGDSGANNGKPYNITQKYDDGSKSRKRKSRVKWITLGTSPEVSDVSLLPPESPLHAGNAADCETSTLEDVQELLQFNEDSCNTSDIDSEDHGYKRRRSGLSSVKTRARKRDLTGIYNVAEGETDNKRPLKSNEDVVANPERVAHKRLKQFKPAESVMKPAKSTEPSKQIWIYDPDSDETSRSSLNCCPKVGLVSDENVWNQKARPIASGKYGIICDQELDLDQIKPPKIVPLSQVLKSSRRLTKFKNQNGLSSTRNMVWSSAGCKFVDTSICSCTRQGNQCIFGLSSCQGGDHGTLCHGAIQMYHKEEETSINDSSVSEKLGANGSKKKICVSSRCTTTQSKPKKSRMRSLYELSMRGNKFISVNFSLSQNVMCAQSTKFEFERKASEDTIKIDAGKCRASTRRSLAKPPCDSFISEADALCCVCGIPNRESTNCLLECCQCLIRIHQACYGVSRLPNGDWYCRPCRTNSKDVACVLCGYGGGAMTRAFGSRNVVKSLLQAWNVSTEAHVMGLGSDEALSVKMECEKLDSSKFQPSSLVKAVVHNSIIGAVDNPAIKQWVHMVCGLWTPGTRCPNVDIMSAFDVSGVSCQKAHMVCSICKRPGGSCIKCHLETCRIHFHPWCAHQKGLLQSEVEGVDSHQVGFYGICSHHTNYQPRGVESDREPDKIDYETEREKEPTCARTQGYKGKKQDGEGHNCYQKSGKNGCLVTQVQLDAWLYINRQKLKMKKLPVPPLSDVDQDYRKEYARYKQAKGWKHLVVYKSGIHGLGLYTSQFFPRGAVVVEYIGEVVGPRVADKRETEYLSGKKLQYKSACYFFRIDKEQIIDATCKGGIARFVNHSCQPNCVAKVITIRSEKKVVFFAQRAIYPGEEITYDYHFNHEDEGKKILCFCNSKNCRRFLN